jgi:hypothetical protein
LNLCVYTVLLGGYEALNEQPIAADSGIPFICFTDNSDLRSDSWQIRHIEPVLACDLVRSQRWPKLRPHALLGEFDASIYIDNTVILTKPPAEIWAALVPDDASLALLRHSHRDTVAGEFSVVRAQGLDEPGRIDEQLEHYMTTAPEVLATPPHWGAILLRRHDAAVAAFADIWSAHVMRYCRRDQLSLNMALHLSGLTPAVHKIDNGRSWFHQWPVSTGRRRELRVFGAPSSANERLARFEKLVDKPYELERTNRELLARLEALEGSRSWRPTAPLRGVNAILHRLTSGK